MCAKKTVANFFGPHLCPFDTREREEARTKIKEDKQKKESRKKAEARAKAQAKQDEELKVR